MDVDDRSLSGVLIRDHARIRDLIARLVTPGEECRQLADELTSELMRHMVAEELYLYPAVHKILPERAVDVSRHHDVDGRVEQILADLGEAEPASHAFDALITRLIAEGRRSVLDEELDVLPRLVQYGDKRTLIELGDMFNAFKDIAVVEKTCGAGLAVRVGDWVVHRRERSQPPAPS
jgi:chorismate mutase